MTLNCGHGANGWTLAAATARLAVLDVLGERGGSGMGSGSGSGSGEKKTEAELLRALAPGRFGFPWFAFQSSRMYRSWS